MLTVHQTFILNHIEVGNIKVVVDLTMNQLNLGQVREIMAAAIHAMKDNDLSEIIVKTTGWSEQRTKFMRGYDFYPYGGQEVHYRLVNPNYEEVVF